MNPDYYPDRHQYNFFRPLDWRWRRAWNLVERVCRLSPHRDDAETIGAAQFLRSAGRCRTDRDRMRLRKQWPAIVGAQELADRAGPLRDEVRARLLAGQTDEQIAARCGADPGVVGRFESLFFHVRDRLAARDWVAALIGPGLRWGFNADEMGRLWMAFAYAGGPLALDAVMAVTAPGTRAGTTFSAATLRSADLAVRATMIPADASLRQLAELHAGVRRFEKLGRQTDSPDRTSRALALLDESLAAAPQQVATLPEVTAAVA